MEEINKALPLEISWFINFDFLKTFRDEVVEIFKQNDINQGRKPGDYENSSYWEWWVYMDGTSGCVQAMSNALEKHNLQAVKEYYETLSWENSELFDDKIMQMLVEVGLVVEGDPEQLNIEE